MIRTRDDSPRPSGETPRRAGWWAAFARTGAITSLALAGCGDKTPPPSPPCEQDCLDGVALRALRETMKAAFNNTFQGKDVGTHDETHQFIRGSARVFGEASSNAQLGTTKVNLTYVFTQAAYYQKDNEPEENFAMIVDGTITQEGTLAVQPSSPTSLVMRSEGMTLVGKVYDPPVDYPTRDYPAISCPVELNQNGNKVAGLLCGREAGFEF
jgi:hypothetical protein